MAGPYRDQCQATDGLSFLQRRHVRLFEFLPSPAFLCISFRSSPWQQEILMCVQVTVLWPLPRCVPGVLSAVRDVRQQDSGWHDQRAGPRWTGQPSAS
ncbi:hypothetical protein D4764_13G0003280 [Takifugu flavidus]|uniref:Uncharacterized protein n=1 Tax=Takifugu flavidus TaxID=433684 RepID=A0A5C6P8Z2_9TELE|nr:hypothetical protein D4764_13G0003280 [Takifugu flavidus]